jgi:hypothetical protein
LDKTIPSDNPIPTTSDRHLGANVLSHLMDITTTKIPSKDWLHQLYIHYGDGQRRSGRSRDDRHKKKENRPRHFCIFIKKCRLKYQSFAIWGLHCLPDSEEMYILNIIRFAVIQETPELRFFGKNQDLFFIQDNP